MKTGSFLSHPPSKSFQISDLRMARRTSSRSARMDERTEKVRTAGIWPHMTYCEAISWMRIPECLVQSPAYDSQARTRNQADFPTRCSAQTSYRRNGVVEKSLSLSLYIYIYIYIHCYTQTHVYLSLSIYIYIYIYIYVGRGRKVFAILLTQLTADPAMTVLNSENGENYFKTIPESMYTLLIYGTFLDNLGAPARPRCLPARLRLREYTYERIYMRERERDRYIDRDWAARFLRSGGQALRAACPPCQTSPARPASLPARPPARQNERERV